MAVADMTEGSLPPGAARRGMASAGLWSVGGKLAARVFDLATLVILAAILTPADFGLVAKAMTVVLLVEVITLMPVETPILRVREPDRRLYDTAFTLTLLRAGAICGLLVLLSGPLALFFNDPRLAPLMWVLALGPALRGCISPKMAEFVRGYDLRPEAMMDISAKLVSLVVVTGVALATRSYWAIALGTVTTAAVLNGLSYVLAPYRPRLSLSRWRDFSDIVTWVTLSQTLQALNWQLDNFILGRLLGNDAFGRYAISRNLNDIPYQAMAIPLTRPMVAAFSAAETEAARRELWLRFSNGALFAVGPVLVALAVLSEGAIFVVLGPGWEGSATYLAGLALATLPVLPAVPLNPFAASVFQTRLIALRIFAQFCISVPVMVAGALWAGVMGAIVAKAVIGIFMLGFIARILRDRLGLPLRAQVLSYVRSLSGLVLLAGLLYFGRDVMASATEGDRLLTAIRLAALGLPCLAAYLLFCMVIWRLVGRPGEAEDFLWRKLGALARRG